MSEPIIVMRPREIRINHLEFFCHELPPETHVQQNVHPGLVKPCSASGQPSGSERGYEPLEQCIESSLAMTVSMTSMDDPSCELLKMEARVQGAFEYAVLDPEGATEAGDDEPELRRKRDAQSYDLLYAFISRYFNQLMSDSGHPNYWLSTVPFEQTAGALQAKFVTND